MITIIYSTHKDSKYNKEFKLHLSKTIGIKNYEILEFENHNQYSLSEIYNKGISQSKYDIVVCIHNDIKLEQNWGKKLLKDFEKNPDFGIIGKAGSCYFPESGIYWERMNQTMVGQVYHHPPGQKKWINRYSTKLPELIPVVTIDGLFISLNKTKIKHTFDETIGKFHFYDHGFCVPNYLDGIKIGVTTSFEITHQSVGKPNQEFFESKDKFLEKYKSVLPIDLKPSKVFVEQLIEKPIKNIGKVAVIIPTKGNVDMLFNCINSLIDHCNSNLFEIFIADTGSSEKEKTEVKSFIFENKEKVIIKLIEYDYYNFAKINNDVVKNHIDERFEFLLFCNNDIVILNNVIYGMLKTFKDNVNVGTVGARLHYSDNTTQHNGIIMIAFPDRSIRVTHEGLLSYYKYNTSIKQVLGNTGALLMIKKSLFEKCGYFNEIYYGCFEDVELNIKCISLGRTNYFNGNLVAYHLESQTRNQSSDKNEQELIDYNTKLVPFINQNLDKIKNLLLYANN
jgi:GT2 family glycosyltransferase